MRFAVETWAPEYGTPVAGEAMVDASSVVDAGAEVPLPEWAPRDPAGAEPVRDLLFVDGVRRVEAHVWITGPDGEIHPGLCASYAAGGLRCNGATRLEEARVERGLFCATRDAEPIRTRHADFGVHVVDGAGPDDLSLLLQRAMGTLEARVTAAAGPDGVVLVDGPLRQGQALANAVGYIKTHHKAYGPPPVRRVVAALGVGQRTPLMVVGQGDLQKRWSWYLRLPCPRPHGWTGVVRLEAPAERPRAEVVAVADRLAVTLGRFASGEQKDARAPQNLYPIGGLERELRRRLGDQALIFRALRAAAAGR